MLIKTKNICFKFKQNDVFFAFFGHICDERFLSLCIYRISKDRFSHEYMGYNNLTPAQNSKAISIS